VFLDVDLHVGARRIYEDVKSNTERNEPRYKTFLDAENAVRKRMEGDLRRYKKYYDKDIHDKSQYDIVIDTTRMTPEEVAEKIVSEASKAGLKNNL